MASCSVSESLPFPMCDICHCDYDDESRNPMLLPCGHVYCKNCLSNMEDRSSQECPKKYLGGCNKKLADWSMINICDLTVVYSMIPSDRGITVTGRAVAPAPDGYVSPSSNRAVAPTRPTGRAVAPADDSMDVDKATSQKKNMKGCFPECDICTDHFNRSNKKPLLLGCGHVFCRECLVVIGEAKKSCPCCREDWDAGKLEELPVVLSLIHPANADRKSTVRQTTSGIIRRAESLNDFHPGKTTNHLLKPTETNTKTQLFVRGVNGKTHTIRMRLDGSIESLRTEVNSILGMRPEHQSLQYEGKVLQDGRTLLSYNIKNNSTINMVGRLRGGQ